MGDPSFAGPSPGGAPVEGGSYYGSSFGNGVPHAYLRTAHLPAGRSSFADLKRENSLLLREDVERGALVYRGLPEVVTLNHTDLCNLRCVMCPRHERQGKHRLSRAVLEYLADSLFPTAYKTVLTTSTGEPLVADFDFLVERALRFGVKIDVVTNGVLLYRELYRRARAALDHLNISLDSHLPEVYERIRLGARFERVHASLQAISEERRRSPDAVLFSLSAVVMRSNLEHLADFVRFAASVCADGVILQRLRHETKATPDEDPLRRCGQQELLRCFAEAEGAAREVGVNLFMSEFGRPAILVRPVREKVPPPLEGRGLCWFLAQNFGVMYTGEVYPCCIPTDYRLGDVLYQDPVTIWNGEPAQRLRAAHLERRGNLFCSGCLHAPHLPATTPPPVAAVARRGRMALAHAMNSARRRLAARFMPRIFDPPFPRVTVCHEAFVDHGVRLESRPLPHANEVLTRNGAGRAQNDDPDKCGRRFGLVAGVADPGGPESRGSDRETRSDKSPYDWWFIRSGALYRARSPEAHAEVVARLREDPSPRATCLRFISPEAALLAFEEEGRLQRLEITGSRVAVRDVLELSEARSFVRQGAVAVDGKGHLWVGEYGVFPGARCAWLYRSDDGGETFERLRYFAEAKHVHAVAAPAECDGVLVTTGDLGSERRLYRVHSSGRVRTLRDTWSGFTAIARSERYLHFGTDLDRGNGLLRWRCELRGKPEFRPLPSDLDSQIRQIMSLGNGRLLALTGMDADLGELREGRRAAILESHDEGESWEVAHRFAVDWGDVPEGLVAEDGTMRRFLTVCTNRAYVLSFPDGRDQRPK
ncbi:MAG: radical SAM protein [Planctomycetota bacterium]